MDVFWGNLKTHWSSLDATDLLTLFYITLLALFIFAANRLFVGKFFLTHQFLLNVPNFSGFINSKPEGRKTAIGKEVGFFPL